MLSPLLGAAAGTGFLFLMTSLGAACVFFLPETVQNRSRSVLFGFAAGVMAAASVWSLLLPAIAQAQARGLPGWLPACVGMALGVLFLNASDAAAQETAPESLLTAAITLHNIPEGMAVGLAFALTAGGDGYAGAAALALGIGIQNFPEGAAISLPLRQSGKSRMQSFRAGVLSGSVEPVAGMLAVLAASFASVLMPWLLSFAAGAMLCVVAQELLPQSQGRSGTFGALFGFLLMMVLDVALG